MAPCVPEYSACIASSACCAPHHCFRQSQFFAQCGRACPRAPSWECHAERMRRAGVILSRWGSWPAWTPLLMHTLRANAKVEFLLVTDVRPAGTLPPNVAVHNVSLDGLLARARATVGSRLVSLGGTDGGKFASGVSANKVNDLKPMYGEIFADLLAEFGWWGHLQEDVVLGDLLALAEEMGATRFSVLWDERAHGTQSLLPPALAAIGLDAAQAKGNVLLSLGRDTTAADVDHVLEIIPKQVDKLRTLSPTWDA